MKDKKRVLMISVTAIIVIIVIVGIVLACVAIKDYKIKSYYKEVETAACKYANEEKLTKNLCDNYQNLCNIKYDRLISSGKLNSSLKNPETGVMAKDNTKDYVEISWNNEKMECIHKEG